MVSTRNQVAVEDYLKAIFNLGEWDPDGRTNANVAARLGVSTSSVSEMLRKLRDADLVDHEPYGRIELSASGRARAVEMVRRHRLVETFLVQTLGYSWDEVHAEAEVLEHAVSPLMVRRMEEAMGYPWRDPHGDPIPTEDGVMHQPQAHPLGEMAPGDSGYVSRLLDDDPHLLRWFSEHGIELDGEIAVSEQKPFGGPLLVEVGPAGATSAVELGIQAVASIWVAAHRPATPGADGSGCPYPDCLHVASQ